MNLHLSIIAPEECLFTLVVYYVMRTIQKVLLHGNNA